MIKITIIRVSINLLKIKMHSFVQTIKKKPKNKMRNGQYLLIKVIKIS